MGDSDRTDEKKLCQMVINGISVLVDINDVHIFAGDKAAVIRGDGSLAVTELAHFKDVEEFGGERWALEPRAGYFQTCVIVGRVIEAPL